MGGTKPSSWIIYSPREALLSGYGKIFRKGDAKTLNINLIGQVSFSDSFPAFPHILLVSLLTTTPMVLPFSLPFTRITPNLMEFTFDLLHYRVAPVSKGKAVL